MRLYDSLSQEKKEFVPRDKDRVTMYFCGPTVYNYVHVGNARPFVVSMVAKRYFESLGLRGHPGGEHHRHRRPHHPEGAGRGAPLERGGR